MFKKITVVTALSTALLFGGALNSVDASASTGQSQGQSGESHKIYYSVNGNWNLYSGNNINDFLNNYFGNHYSNQGKSDWNNHKNNQSKKQNKQNEEKQEQPKKEQNEKVNQQQPKQEAETPTQQPTKTEEQPGQSASQQLNEYEQQVVELTNQERANYGLEPLEIDTELSRVAREKSNDMRGSSYFSHNSPTYGSPFDMMQSYGISYRSAGENIARGQRTPEEVVNAWMNSEGHRANILNESFTHIGVGFVEQGNYWTQHFIGK